MHPIWSLSLAVPSPFVTVIGTTLPSLMPTWPFLFLNANVESVQKRPGTLLQEQVDASPPSFSPRLLDLDLLGLRSH